MTLNDEASIIDFKNRQPPAYIAVEGPIGVGKTTLAKRLAETFNHQALLENIGDNPFLEGFYQNQKNAALATQLFFLFQRAQQIQDQRQADIFEPVQVSDFLIEKDRLFAQLTLDHNEFQLYQKVYQQLTIEAPKPDLVIYLQAPVDVLTSRIQSRGITFEQNISSEYLTAINAAYTEFFLYYDDAPLLIINAEEIDLINRPSDYAHFVDYLLNIRNGRHYYNPTIF
ncbi:deoxynucleoside kinase [Dasania marina]|uniref:deoxynucleoside kinase n=1 Tax=Dasania marina TaxID=471499 RepID=UPI000374C318|nr:deoxynucleoside kinase [Dasania marina]